MCPLHLQGWGFIWEVVLFSVPLVYLFKDINYVYIRNLFLIFCIYYVLSNYLRHYSFPFVPPNFFFSKSVMVLNFVYPVSVASSVAFSSAMILFFHSLHPLPTYFSPLSALITFTLPFCKFWKLSFQRGRWIFSPFETLENTLQTFSLIFVSDSSFDVCSLSVFLPLFLFLSLFSWSTHKSYC